MSSADRNEQRATLRASDAADIDGAANDLMALLGAISNQIADADRRQADALNDMQARLSALGQEARAARALVPKEFLPAFDRIEDGVEELAQRIGAAHGERKPADVPAAAAAVAAQAHAAPAPEPQAAFAPAPLRSAAPQGQGSGWARSETVRNAPAIDPFDFADSTGDGEPWDAQSAEALARVYDSGGSARMADPDADDQPAGDTDVTHALVDAGRKAGASRGGMEVEKDWLEKRFADIAVRVEQSLSEIRPDSSFLALGQRFDQFEERFGSVLGDVATRADVEGLRLIEAHINELAQHLEQTQSQLARLDGIEAQLGDLIGRIADQGAPLTAFGEPMLPDMDHLAEAAAARVAERLAHLTPAPAVDAGSIATEAVERFASRIAQQKSSDTRVDDLRHVLEDFIAERRSGDEQTQSMLDTMQQAMIRVLDRMDAMETAQHTQQARSAPFGYAHEAVRFNAEQAGAAFSQRPSHADGSATGAGIAAAAAASAAPYASPFAHTPGDDAAIAARSPIEKKRQDFIDEARRAKQRAAEAAADENVHVLKDAAVKIPAERVAKTAGGKAGVTGKSKPSVKAKTVAADGDTPPTILGYPRQKLLISAFAMVALIAGTSLVLRKPARAPQQPTAAATQVPAKPAAPKSEAAPAKASPEASAAPTAKPEAAPNGANTRPSTSDPTKHLRPTPQTGVDDLGFDAMIVPPGEQRAEASELLPGVAVYKADNGATQTVTELARLRQQQSIATNSSRLGVEAVHTTPAALVPANILTATPAAATAAAPAADAAASASTRSSNLDLPPVTVGPLSLRLAAAKGDPSAEFEVASRLAEGKGTNQNFKEALRWYQRSATQGFAQAQYRLGTLFERGLGTKADGERARVWYRRAAEQGNMKAMHNLAVLSAGRVGNSPDYDTAARFFTEAAELGLADSQFNLGVLYQNGLGVAKDEKQAYKWLAIAARSGDKETARRRDELKAMIGPADAAAIDQQVAGWQARVADRIANDARAAGELWKTRESAASTSEAAPSE